jgi:hypothetical protein
MIPRTRRLTLLALLLGLALFAVDLPELHQHDGATAGLFDEDCPFERLASAPPGAPLPHRLDPGPLLSPPSPLFLGAAPSPARIVRPASGARAPPSIA